MKLSKLLFAVVALLGFVGSVVAQNVETNKTHGVLGYLDPKTGMFRSLTREARSAADPSITPTTGSFTFNVTITVSSTLPTTAVIECEVYGAVSGDAQGTFTNDVYLPASRTGNTATCTITVPYEWYLKTPTTDKVALDLQVSTSTLIGKESYGETFSGPAYTGKVPTTASTTVAITTTI